MPSYLSLLIIICTFLHLNSGSELRKIYHTTNELIRTFKGLEGRCPGLSFSYERDLKEPKELFAVRLTRAENPTHRALLFFGEHARELISPETALAFVQSLCFPAASLKHKANKVLENTEFLIFPVINPEGRRKVEGGDYCVRVNDNGVDLNRNWDDHWSGDSTTQDTSPGLIAFSEPETRILRDAATAFRPTIFITVHSGALGMYTPYAYSLDVPSAANPAEHILRHVNPSFCSCDVGAAGKQVGYLCPGTCLDYMFDKLDTRFSFAFEIWDGKSYRKDSPVMLEQKSSCFIQRPSSSSSSSSLLSSAASRSSHRSLSPRFTELHARSRSHSRSQRLDESDANEMEAYEEVEMESGAEFMFPDPTDEADSGCLNLFNPTSALAYHGTVRNWSRALLTVINQIVANSA